MALAHKPEPAPLWRLDATWAPPTIAQSSAQREPAWWVMSRQAATGAPCLRLCLPLGHSHVTVCCRSGHRGHLAPQVAHRAAPAVWPPQLRMEARSALALWRRRGAALAVAVEVEAQHHPALHRCALAAGCGRQGSAKLRPQCATLPLVAAVRQALNHAPGFWRHWWWQRTKRQQQQQQQL